MKKSAKIDFLEKSLQKQFYKKKSAKSNKINPLFSIWNQLEHSVFCMRESSKATIDGDQLFIAS